jgi:protein-L-isoaspartate(D-aspartate) O-methyltransferase
VKDYERQRRRMVEHQIRKRGVRDGRVLAAMEKVPRHRFVPESAANHAYEDSPLSIGKGQTISQPYMVALMTEALVPEPGDRVLEVGTGSGYQTAILAELVSEVYSIERIPELGERAEALLYSIERIPELGERAEALLSRLGYENVLIQIGDGSEGWVEKAPFDAIVVTAGAPEIPDPLVEQLAAGGRLVIPIGSSHHQTLCTVKKEKERIRKEEGAGCVFVPLIGAFGWEEKRSERQS